jgi:hypothetical protein
MEKIRWQDLGFSDNESRELSLKQRGSDAFSLERELRLWAQWVSEAERGIDWTVDELHAVWGARDAVDLSIAQLLTPEQQDRVFAWLDELDQRFRENTVRTDASGPDEAARWWRGRVTEASPNSRSRAAEP